VGLQEEVVSIGKEARGRVGLQEEVVSIGKEAINQEASR